MNQEELSQLKALLEKAKEALPGATEFMVHEDDRGFCLRGWETEVEHAHVTQSEFNPDGSIKLMEYRIN